MSMSDVLWLVLGWVLGIFTSHILEPITRWFVTGWYLVTRPKKDRGSLRYELEKNWNLDRVRQFLKISDPKKRDLSWPS